MDGITMSMYLLFQHGRAQDMRETIFSSMKTSRCSKKIGTKKAVSFMTTTLVRLAPNQYIVREIGTNPQTSEALYRNCHKNQIFFLISFTRQHRDYFSS